MICICRRLQSGSPLPTPRGLEGKRGRLGSGGVLALRLSAATGSLQALALADRGGDTGAAGSHRIQGRTPPLNPSPGDGERPRGPGGGGGTRSCGGRRLPPVFVQLESPPPPRVTRLALAKTGGEGERGDLRVAKSW